MYMWSKRSLLAAALALAGSLVVPTAVAETGFDLGRPATDSEIDAWDIDVRPDFKGLPKGQGTVMDGEDLWEATCAACHGSFAESNAYFTPLIGGTTEEDIETGKVASLTSPTQSSRTIIMTTPTVSTLWDYIYRAMPWDNPRSLSPDDVYAALAYLLSLADIVDYDFTLSHENMAEVQERMPNRNGVVFWEGLWNVDGEPDTHNTDCMTDCVDTVEVSSEMPERARDAHGDMALQNRIVGPVRGVNTLEPQFTGTLADNSEQFRTYARAQFDEANQSSSDNADDSVAVRALLEDNGCMACHGIDSKKIGPSFMDVASKYADDADAADMLVGKVQEGGSGNWGSVPMPPNPGLSDDDTRTIIDWILSGNLE